MSDEDKFSRLKEEFIKINEDMVRLRGNEPIFGKIIATIILSPTQLTQEDISKATGYSRSQISRILKNLEASALITTRTKPGSRTQLYEGKAKSFLNNFRQLFEISRRFFSEKVKVLDLIREESKKLPKKTKETAEYKKFDEVVSVFNSMIYAFLEILDEFINRFEKRMGDIEREIIKKKF